MQLAAPHQAAGDVGRLQRRALGRRMGGEIAGDRNENVPALVGVAPEAKLPDPGLQHLARMEAQVFPQHRMRERGDQRLRRMAEFEMPRHEPCRKINLSLAVERVEQGGPDRLRPLWLRRRSAFERGGSNQSLPADGCVAKLPLNEQARERIGTI